jgi:hypothetical protein
MKKYTHVDALYQVSRYVRKVNKDPEVPERYKVRGVTKFKGTVKLHGTNAGVACTKEGLVPQSRNTVLSLQNDNNGFAAFVHHVAVQVSIRGLEKQFRVAYNLHEDATLTLFGEWIGNGVQKGMAINQLPVKQWVIFAAAVTEGEKSRYLEVFNFHDYYEDVSIYSILKAGSAELEVDLDDLDSVTKAAEEATKKTLAVEVLCPWGALFGLAGMGEGLVWTPLGDQLGNSDLFFKTKGEKHKTQKSKKTVQATPEELANVQEFLEFAVTPRRLEQGFEYLAELGLEPNMRSVGDYLRWVCQDVQRECAVEIEEAETFEWKNVAKKVASAARTHYIQEFQAGTRN